MNSGLTQKTLFTVAFLQERDLYEYNGGERSLQRSFSVCQLQHALVCWPKPDYGPMEVQRTEFMNGMRVAAAKPLGSQMAACTVMFQAGSRMECDDELGATHFIRAASALSGCMYTSFMRSRYLQQYGGYLTSNSDRQTISFTLRCPAPFFADLKNYLLDTASRITFRHYELNDKVKPLVKDDLKRIPSGQLCLDLVQKACWGGALSNPVYCAPARISGMSPETLQGFTEKFFTTNRCTIASYGMPFEETLKVAEYIDCGRTERPMDYCPGASFSRSGYETYDLGPDATTYVALAVPGCGTCNLDCLLKYSVLAAAMGFDDVARGHETDRAPQPPIAYLAKDDIFTQYRAFNISYYEHGTFGIILKSKPACVRDAALSAARFMFQLGNMNACQIQVGKKRLKLGLSLQEDDCVKVSEGLALQISNNYKIDSARSLFSLIDMIPDSDVVNLARSIAALAPYMAVAVVGDVGAAPHDGELRCYI